jgi:short-subunit dehydrogenase
MPKDLTGKVIVVTGANSGIGAVTVRACARAGMDCVLNARDEARLAEMAEEVRQLGRRVEVVAGDVTDPAVNRRMLDVAAAQLGGFYAVFANAGYGFKKPTHELSIKEFRRIFDVNFFAATDLVTEAARRLIAARRRGHLLMCSSAVAKFTLVNFAAYSTTKAAQNHVCRAMRLELKRYGIDVTSVHPITTRTAFFERSAQYQGRSYDPDRVFDRVPGWLLQRPEQVADAIVRCLRRPKPEVWMSGLTRFAAAVVTLFPGLGDVLGERGQEID